MVDKTLWQTDDQLNQTNLSEAQALSLISGYVERGMSITPDYTNSNFSVGSGLAIPRQNNKAYLAFLDQRTGISMPAPSGMNYIYVTTDPAVEGGEAIHVDTDDTPPSTPSVKIGEIDGSAQTTTELNRNADGQFDSITANSLSGISSLDINDLTTTNATISNLSTSGGDVTLDSVSSTTVNNVEWVLPGDSIQTAIDAVASNNGTVALAPNTTYNEGSAIYLSKGVTLIGNGATIEVTADHNGLEIDNETKVLGFTHIHVTHSSYTSSGVLISTANSTDGSFGYGSSRRQTYLDFEVEVETPNVGSSCVTMTDPGNGGISFILGNWILYGSERPINMFSGSTNGFVNGNYINVIINNGVDQIYHGGGGPARTTFNGVIQTSAANTDRNFYNAAGTNSFAFTGDVWDSAGCAVSSIEGENISALLWGSNQLGSMLSGLDSTLTNTNSGAASLSGTGITWLNANQGYLYKFGSSFNSNLNEHFTWAVNFDDGNGMTDIMNLDVSSGNLYLRGTVNENAI